jgi:hypothetical protein
MQKFERSFQVWEYWVTHAQLLVRSPGDIYYPRNIDIVFRGVWYMELPTIMPDLELVAPLPEEQRRATEIVGRPIPIEEVFVLVSGGCRYLVVALGMRVEENDMPFMKSSLEWA